MSLSSRQINIALVQQTPRAEKLYIVPLVPVGAEGEVLLAKYYIFETEPDGTATIELPVKPTGTITYRYEISGDIAGIESRGTFNLEAGAAIDLSELIAGSPEATDAVRDYIDQQIAALGVDDLNDVEASAPAEGETLKWDSTAGKWVNTNKLRLFDGAYEPWLAGAEMLFSVASPDFIASGDKHVLGEVLDLKWDHTGSTSKSIYGRATRIDTQGIGVSPTVIGNSVFIENTHQNDSDSANWYGYYTYLNVEHGINTAIGGYFFAGIGSASAGTGTTSLTGILGAVGTSHNGGLSNLNIAGDFWVQNPADGTSPVVPNSYMLRARLTNRNAHVLTNVYGLGVTGWSNTGEVTNSYGVYLDESIDVGSEERYAIRSLSKSPSVFDGGVSIPPQTQSPFGLTGEYVGPIKVSLNIGDNTLYTVPAGKKALVLPAHYTTSSTNAILYKIVEGVNEIPLLSTAPSALAVGNGAAQYGWVLTAGQSLVANSSGAGQNVIFDAFLFDEDIPLVTASLEITNTPELLYKVPAGKKAIFVTPMMPHVNPFQGSWWWTFAYNGSANSAAYSGYWTPGGDTFNATTDKLFTRNAVPSGSGSIFYLPSRLNEGDEVRAASSIADAGQWVTASFYEYDV